MRKLFCAHDILRKITKGHVWEKLNRKMFHCLLVPCCVWNTMHLSREKTVSEVYRQKWGEWRVVQMTSEGTWFTSWSKKVNKNFLPVCGKNKHRNKKTGEELMRKSSKRKKRENPAVVDKPQFRGIKTARLSEMCLYTVSARYDSITQWTRIVIMPVVIILIRWGAMI